MKRRLFLAGSVSLAAFSAATGPLLARSVVSNNVVASVTRKMRLRNAGVPGGCANHRRRASPHAGFTLADALSDRFGRSFS